LDGNGVAMPWLSQGYYDEGGEIIIESYLDTHHNGHMEARVCVINDADPNSCTTPEHFAGKELVFELDLALGGHTPMPKDQNYTERGMYAGGQHGSIKAFKFRFKLPMGISGDKVMLQWKYTTANSVSLVYAFYSMFLCRSFNCKVSSLIHTYFSVFPSWIC
jgi:hypothetical protein